MKGSVPTWFWIAGGVIAGLLIFISAYQMLFQTTGVMSDQKALEPYNEIKSLVENDLCFSAPGNKRYLKVQLSESISAIYFTDDKYTTFSDEEYSIKAVEGEVMKGSLICLKIADRRLQCEELSCPASMPLIGAVPAERSLSALVDRILGRHKTFEYRLELEKKSDYVEISRQ
jgi:hypothetical protein